MEHNDHARHRDAFDAVPRAPGFDLSATFLKEGYAFMPRRHADLGSDVFSTRLMLRRALCVRGEDAGRMFYQPGASRAAMRCRRRRWPCCRISAA